MKKEVILPSLEGPRVPRASLRRAAVGCGALALDVTSLDALARRMAALEGGPRRGGRGGAQRGHHTRPHAGEDDAPGVRAGAGRQPRGHPRCGRGAARPGGAAPRRGACVPVLHRALTQRAPCRWRRDPSAASSAPVHPPATLKCTPSFPEVWASPVQVEPSSPRTQLVGVPVRPTTVRKSGSPYTCIAVCTQGCQLNRSPTARLARKFA